MQKPPECLAKSDILFSRSCLRERVRMRRRDFIGLVIGGVAWPLPARTQRSNKMGILNLRAGATTVAVMRPAWQRLGYTEGHSVLLRAAQGEGSRFPSLIAELINEGSGVLIAVGAEAVR